MIKVMEEVVNSELAYTYSEGACTRLRYPVLSLATLQYKTSLGIYTNHICVSLFTRLICPL